MKALYLDKHERVRAILLGIGDNLAGELARPVLVAKLPRDVASMSVLESDAVQLATAGP